MTPDAQQHPPPPAGYRRAFWKSAPHLFLAVLTLGLGLASAHPIGLLAGAAAYALGLIYIPDTRWFKRRIDATRQTAQLAGDQARACAFATRRAQITDSLTPARQQRYAALLAICHDISTFAADAATGELNLSLDTRLRKLDELLWTYLRLLSIGQTLETYLETERRENLPASLKTAEAEITALETELAADSANETRKRLLSSRRERLLALRRRLERITQARANLELTRSEQERLVEQAKLIRADAIASKNAGALGARIDLSIEHLAETNHWLNELSDFKDLTGQLPSMPPGALLQTPPPLPFDSPAQRTRQTRSN